MLNELYSMQKGLETIGKSPEIKHNDIKSPGKGTTFRVLLDPDGNVRSVKLLDKKDLEDTWTLGDSNKNQFPTIKLVKPLIQSAHEEYSKWKKENKNPKEETYREFITEQINKHSINEITCWPDYRDRIIERKSQFDNEYKNENFYQIFDRYSKSGNKGANILFQYLEKIKEEVGTSGIKSLQAICDALFGAVVNGNGVVEPGKRVTFLLDARPNDDTDDCASSRTEVPPLSKALFELESGRSRKKMMCALTGIDCDIVENVFPEEKLSIVGSTKLFAKNSGTSGPTVKRYEHAGAESYPVSDELSKKLAASIAFLSSEELKEETWIKIPSPTGSSPSLLLAYCKDDLNLPVPKLITDSGIEDFDDYQDATKTVLDLYENSNCTPDAVVHLSEIIVLDKANRKINYSNISTIDEVKQAADEWIKACKNRPEVKLLAQGKKEKLLLSPWPVAPVKICSLSRQKYIRNGESSTSIPGISFSDAMSIFFSKDDDSKQLSKQSLDRLSNQFEPLFTHCALSKTQYVLGNNHARVKTNTRNNTQTLNAVTIMSALLYKIGRKEVDYMNDFAYQLGQLCSALDELHIGYCKSMRGGDIPNTLIGNLTYGMALQSPKKGLDVMASRIKPYKAWATNPKSFSSEDKAIKAGIYAYRWLAGQAEKLNERLAEMSITDTYKAELMLGYLAGRPFEGKKDQTQSSDTKGG